MEGQEPRIRKNEEPRTENQEPARRRVRRSAEEELRQLSEHWGRGLLSTEEAIGWLLACLVRQNQEPRTKNQEHPAATLPAQALGTLLRQLAEAVDALAGSDLDVWRVGDLWYWRWEDSGDLSVHGLCSLGEALADAVEQRHPATFPLPEG